LRVHVYTVPGSVFYEESYLKALTGVSGVATLGLSVRDRPSFGTCARRGEGVRETFAACLEAVHAQLSMRRWPEPDAKARKNRYAE
jgi:hypothetical protein